ncbi:hypothetical protein TUM18999_50100 [Pseudomonas tohonis]|uniref:Uncharacterized protein n=1 Tax=Pseudomonas tohonis TaxID=2725477 RepID=A0A6J4EBU8_9PSED|nr:hypothetical protein TUM18999_50100 [Pseudomonas tohonis]GJN50445.1 hypothetical protein TUM20286_01970 [Pseudomonas tohonis]
MGTIDAVGASREGRCLAARRLSIGTGGIAIWLCRRFGFSPTVVRALSLARLPRITSGARGVAL